MDKYGLSISGAVLGGIAVVVTGLVSVPILAGGILTGGSIGGLIQEPNNKGHQVGLALGTALIGTGFIYEAMKGSSVAVQTSNLAEKAKWAANAGEAGKSGTASSYGIDMDNLNFSNTVLNHTGRPYQDSNCLLMK